MRLFIAIEPPPELKQAIAEFTKQNKFQYPNCGRWLNPNDAHITVNFLGEVKADNLAPLAESINLAVKSQTDFDLSITGFAWKPPTEPQLGILEIAATNEFRQLQYNLKNHLKPLGIKVLSRPAHLTLVRVKKNLRTPPLPTFNRHDFTVNEIQLIHSTLTANGPIYKALKAFKLPYKGPSGPYRPNVAICLINSQNELLLVKHPLSKSNYWQMLQGGIEPGETTANAVKRELKEEMGITELEIINITERVHRYRWSEKTKQAGNDASKQPYIGQEQSLALVKLKNHSQIFKPDPREISALKWCSPENFLSELQPVRRSLGKMALAQLKN